MEEKQEHIEDPALAGDIDGVKDVIFKVVFNKKKHDVSFPLDATIAQLKDHLHTIIGVPKEMQKVMVKGLAHDQKSLRESGIVSGSKVMVIGSTFNDVLALSHQTAQLIPEDKVKPSVIKEPLSQQKIHRKILEKGPPEDAMPGLKNVKEALPPHPLYGMCSRGKVRLTFKMENDQIWIGTKERTEKISMSTIKTIVSEPIEGHEEYHILGIQLGPTEASRYWIYWIPSQFVDAIKETILGKWHYF
ncbi:ubiquitin domain-containing protein UBFD1 isoform X1 [Daphnia magna]|uniref:ubiquitin domain-containing protein UBFD1 isoform X1 n=1 Tax=Daphnia magna TaxID=35525 RepID=UPI0006DE6BBD|nr:ubiquitin domain-containing protein UBFD1 isoform X1 [Daphnia magna]